MRYITYGSVRGCNGTIHRSLAGAQKALRADQRGCASQGGYSDRRIYPVEAGQTWEQVANAVDAGVVQAVQD